MRRRIAKELLTPRLLVLAFLGCGAPQDQPADPVVRDNADVRIVENDAPMWTPETAWHVGTEPLLDIGSAEEDPGQELFRVLDALRLPDGTIVIANAGTRELRFFGDDGSYLYAAGGRGDGPGEFQFLRWVQPFGGDSLVAYDSRHARLSYFSVGGNYGRSVTLQRGDRVPSGAAVGLFDDGTALFTTDQRRGQTGAYRVAEVLYRFAADGRSFMDSIGWSPGREIIQIRFDGGSLGGPMPFGRRTLYAVHNEHYYVATTDEFQINVYASTGRLRSVIRKQHDNLPVTDRDLEVMREQWEPRFARVAAPNRSRARRRFEEIPLPETMPAFGKSMDARGTSFHVDRDGNVWMLEYNRIGDASVRWTVFAADGTLLGTLAIPDGLDIFDIGDDYVLGVWRDDLDVEHVALYELLKP